MSFSDPFDAAKNFASKLTDPASLLQAFAAAFTQHTRLLKLNFASDAGIPEGTLLPQRLTGREGINDGMRFELVTLCNDAFLDLKDLLGVAVQVEILNDRGDARSICGLVTEAHQESSDGGFAVFRLVIEDGLSVLRLSRKSRVFVNKSVVEITEQVLSAHRDANAVLAGAFTVDIRCQKAYPQRPFVLQIGESDYDFLRRIWAKAGITFVIRPSEDSSEDHPQHVLQLIDDSLDLDANAAGSVRFHRADGTEESDSVTEWRGVRRLQAGSVSRSAWNPDQVSVATGREDSHNDQGEHGASLSSTLEDYRHESSLEGSEADDLGDQARVRMESVEGQCKYFEGEGSARDFGAGTWFKLTEHPIHDHDDARDREFVITLLEVEAENNLPKDLSKGLEGLLKGGKDEKEGLPYRNRFECVRRGITLTPPERPVPRPGVLSAKVVGPPGEEVHVDEYGRIKVCFHFSRESDHPEAGASGTDADSAWVRISRMWSSQGFGASFHPRVGDEVLVNFPGNDPDKPMVVGCISNGIKIPAAFSGVASLPATKALSGFRSQMIKGLGSNELVLDDTPSELRARLACDHAASQLNLGYLVQPRTGGASFPLGEGFELRTAAWGAMRAAKGLLLTTDGGGGDHLDASPLTSQIDSGLELAKALSDAAENHKADKLGANEDAKKLKESLEGTQKAGSGGQSKDVAAFSDPVIGISSPSGILSATPGSQVISAGEHIHAVSGKDTNLAVGKNLVMAIKEAWSVFVAKSGIKMFAGKGDVVVRAHDGEIGVTAEKDLKVFAITGNLDLLAKNGITLQTPGAKVELKGGNLTITAKTCNIKTAKVDVKAGSKADVPLPHLPTGEMKPGDLVLQHLYHDDEGVQGAAFEVHFSDGSVRKGKTDDQGFAKLTDVPPGSAKVKFEPDCRAYDRKDKEKNPSFGQSLDDVIQRYAPPEPADKPQGSSE